jgi:hypothetical protein
MLKQSIGNGLKETWSRRTWDNRAQCWNRAEGMDRIHFARNMVQWLTLCRTAPWLITAWKSKILLTEHKNYKLCVRTDSVGMMTRQLRSQNAAIVTLGNKTILQKSLIPQHFYILFGTIQKPRYSLCHPAARLLELLDPLSHPSSNPVCTV